MNKDFTKNNTHMVNKHIKNNAQYTQSLEKCKSKTQHEILTHKLEKIKYKHLIIHSAVEDAEQVEFSHTVGVNIKCHSHFSKQVGSFL